MNEPFVLRAADWQSQAACLGDDIAAAFPETAKESRDFIEQNCDRCAVWGQCLTFANTHKAEYGVWAGEDRGRR